MSATSGRDAADAPSGSLNPGLSKDSVGTGKKKEGKGKAERRKKSSKKKKSGRQPKVYPEREPLDQEIDHR